MVSGEIEVEAAAKIPRAVPLESVVVEWNGTAIARFTAPPYRTRMNLGEGQEGILRAVLRLADGSQTEDVRLLNSRALTLETEVNLVEIPAYFETAGVTAEKLILREAGKPRAIDRLIPAADTPLRIALVLDSSSSMTNHMPTLQEAALQFIERDVGPNDETMIVGFGSSLHILLPTRRRDLVERTILRLHANGATPLHDAMITALLRLQVSGSRRALVVFSDGMDNASVFGARDVAEVARRIGVPIYVLSFAPDVKPGPSQRLGRMAAVAHSDLARLGRSSGGKVFRVRSLDQLGAIWSEIGADLRKQSLVVYRTDPAGDAWRTLQLSIRGGGRLRAPSGVYVAGER
jgi:VWFA-related protein